METYIGKVLELAIRRREINISELCRKMNISRRTLYNWFERRKLDTGIVFAIGEIIGHNFANELGDGFNNDNHQALDGVRYPKLPGTLVSKQDEEYYWMQKYIQSLEEYNELLQKVIV